MQKENSNLGWALVSMTGIGRSLVNHGALCVEVIARSVNSRGLDIKCRLPQELVFLEPDVYKSVGSQFDRGRVEIDAKLTRPSLKASRIVIDEEVVSLLLDQLSSWQNRFQHVTMSVALGDILSAPGVVRIEEPFIEEDDLRDLALKAVKGALDDMKKARAHEGAVLQIVIQDMLAEASSVITAIEAMAMADVKQRYERLKLRLDELSDKLGINEDRIIEEFALIAERADFKEEIDRLIAHRDHFEIIGKSGNAIGRKLDFLCQEMLRETNTLMSKAFDSRVTVKAIDLKALIERIREQIQNIE